MGYRPGGHKESDLVTKLSPVGQTPDEETWGLETTDSGAFLPPLSQGEIKHHVEKEVCKLRHTHPKGMPKNEPFSKILAAVPRCPACGQPPSASSWPISPPHWAPRVDWSPSVRAVLSTVTEKWSTLGYSPSPRVLI